MTKGLVLVTGSSGRIGQAVVAELQRRSQPVRGFDLVPTAGLADMALGTLTDPAAVRRAMEGVHTLIHLAATPDDDDFLERIVPNNIIGVHHVLEAARAAGVQRMVLASSGQVVWHQRLSGPWPLGVDVQPTPRYWYAAAKVFLEAAGRAFAESFGMSVIAVRLGWCPRTKEQVEEIAAADWAKDVYLSPRDAGRFFACCVEAPGPFHYVVVYATSKPVERQYVDLETTRRLLGYEPQESWPQGIEVITRGTG
ncbi:MAG: NAD(P)-dependent oxidoreductase [Gemmataceae bacterium]|nr:NAD(P)-dependent oxidoreductase [Gemmataceae bacterium]